MAYPAETDVRFGVAFGATDELTGSLVGLVDAAGAFHYAPGILNGVAGFESSGVLAVGGNVYSLDYALVSAEGTYQSVAVSDVRKGVAVGVSPAVGTLEGTIDTAGVVHATGIINGAGAYSAEGIIDGTTRFASGIYDGAARTATGLFDGTTRIAKGIFDGTTEFATGSFDGTTCNTLASVIASAGGTYVETVIGDVRSGTHFGAGGTQYEGEMTVIGTILQKFFVGNRPH
jgi:hypothetical protein